MSDNLGVFSLFGSEKDDGKVLTGCWLGCLVQTFCIFIGLVLLGIAPTAGIIMMRFWGLMQWIALVPLILAQRSMEHPNTVKGLLITGGIGVLLTAACAGLR